jgi:serine/threonine protein phosphatase PrpC
MGIICAECGWTSRDPEFCDRCNADLKPSAENATSALAPADTPSNQIARLTRPEAAVVANGWRWHWIAGNDWETWQPRVEERQSFQAAALPPCRVVPADGGVWVAAESGGVQARPWFGQTSGDLPELLPRMADFVERLAQALESLHAAGVVWLPFDTLALEETEGRLRFTNLDLAVCPAGRCPAEAVPLPSLVAPEVARSDAGSVGPRTDVFHLALFAYYWISRFLPHGFFGRGLASFDFRLPAVRIFAPDLPPGIEPVLRRGLAVDPGERPATPAAWAAEFRAAVDAAAARQTADGAIVWDVGFHTRVGRTKSALGLANQDAGFVHRYTDPDRLVAAIADGVSSCDVGDGQVASELTCRALATALGPELRAENFLSQIAGACVEAGTAMLSWALEHGGQEELADGADLMGATSLIALLEGRTLHVANIGDSRAYLIHGAGVEQLTVDGDLGCALLAAGAPPEEVCDLGNAARGLYSFVGGSAHNLTGVPTAAARWEPALARWPLLPGDTVVLCSDGLVEEGTFLEPSDLLDLVGRHADLSAQALAETLADAADARQRLPSADEPLGRGDNVTCCVIRILRR